jgi:hypothetical protein
MLCTWAELPISAALSTLSPLFGDT